jgi:hypothetical protein
MCLWGASFGISATPTTPRQSTAPATTGQCRTYTAAATDLETNPNAVPPFTLTNTYTSTFNASTNELTTTGTVTSSTGCSGPFTVAVTYPSVAGFVAEVGVIPPLHRKIRITRSANACGARAAAFAFTYDGQNRVTQFGSTSYTAWDSLGRPTAGAVATGAGISVSLSYDDAARKMTLTLGGNPANAAVTTFDANGNSIGISSQQTGTTAVTTIHSTTTVCQ